MTESFTPAPGILGGGALQYKVIDGEVFVSTEGLTNVLVNTALKLTTIAVTTGDPYGLGMSGATAELGKKVIEFEAYAKEQNVSA